MTETKTKSGPLAFLSALRPLHWLKNTLVLAVIFMDWLFDEPDKLGQVLISAGLFCLLSSAGYLVNDWADRETDSLSPIKSRRPAARGALSGQASLGGAAALAALAFLGGWAFLDLWRQWMTIASLYLATTLLYTFLLKEWLWTGAAAIACAAVLRAMAGEAAVGVYPDRWVLPNLFCLSFLIVFGKRAMEEPKSRGPALSASIAAAAALTVAVSFNRLGFIQLLFKPEGVEGYQWLCQALIVAGVARFLWIALRPADRPVEFYGRIARDPILAPTLALWLAWFVYFGNWWSHVYRLL